MLCIGSKFSFVQFLFPFTREWWGLWKWVLPKEKYTASLYSNIGRIPSSCGGQLWENSLLKLLYYGRLVCWLPAAQELFIRADHTLTGLRCGEKNGVEGHKKITWILFPSPARLPLNSPIFSLLSFSPNCGARSQAKLIAVQDFVFSKWFCTDIIVCTSKLLSPFPSLPWLITFLLLIKINRGHVRHVRSVKFLHVLFSYTRIYITFNSTSPASYFSFTVSLFVCVPSSETVKGKYI